MDAVLAAAFFHDKRKILVSHPQPAKIQLASWRLGVLGEGIRGPLNMTFVTISSYHVHLGLSEHGTGPKSHSSGTGLRRDTHKQHGTVVHRPNCPD